jgi:hypothetical protein
MSTRTKMSFKQGSKVWVWDSMWLPAIVVQRAPMGSILVRVEHGLTFTASTVNLVPRDPACQQTRPPSLRQGVQLNGAIAFEANPTAAKEALISTRNR